MERPRLYLRSAVVPFWGAFRTHPAHSITGKRGYLG